MNISDYATAYGGLFTTTGNTYSGPNSGQVISGKNTINQGVNFGSQSTNMHQIDGDFYQNQAAFHGNHNVLNNTPYQINNPWSTSFQQNVAENTAQTVDEIDNPTVGDWFPSSKLSPPLPPHPHYPPQAGPSTVDPEKTSENSVSQKGTTIGSWPSLVFRQIYLHFLLRLPSLYYSRVEGIFEDANLSLKEIKDLALRSVIADCRATEVARLTANLSSISETTTLELPPSYQTMKNRWEFFIDGLLEEWRTLNIVSALLVPGILTMFQITGGASQDPITRYLSFWSLLSALVSLMYGCIYIIQFARMRKAYNILEWALEMQTQRWLFWDVVVMLSMPVLWLTWSILAFIVCIVWFMWRSRVNMPDDAVFTAASSTELGFRIFICVTLAIAAIFGTLILSTFRRYGSKMNTAWQKRATDLLSQLGPQSAPRPQH